MKKTIKLGKKLESPESVEKMDSKEYFPSLYIDDIDGLQDIPESGEATIKFKRRRMSETTDDEGSKKSVDLEITSISFDGESDEEPDGDEGYDWIEKEAKKQGVKTSDEEEEHTEPDGDEE